MVLEHKGFDKYSVWVDGSGRVTDRNRRFLRAFEPAEAPRIPAPGPQVDEPQGPGHREDVHINVPQATVPTEAESEPPQVTIDTKPQKVATPSPQHCIPSPQPPPWPTPATMSRSQ